MKLRLLLSLIICSLTLGCATSGINGTTTLKSSYNSKVESDGAEDTSVSIEAKGKAGDVLEAVTNASLITKDGTGSERNMSFGANQNNDATRRADSIDAMNAAWSQAFVQVNDMWSQVVNAIGSAFIPAWQNVELGGQAASVEKAKARAGAIVEGARVLTPNRPNPTPPVVEDTPLPLENVNP